MTRNEGPADPPRGQDAAEPVYRRGPIARCLSVFGILFPRRRRQWILLTRRFHIIALVTVAVVLGLIGWFFFSFSASPTFCNSCHFMETYVDSWQGSSHKDVACDKCHFPPGWRNYLRGKVAATTHLIKTLTGTGGTKPHAEIDDAACQREGCHETVTDDLVFKKDRKEYRFSHTSHLGGLRRGKRLRCTSCHSQIVQGLHITVTESVCFTCHFKDEKYNGILSPIAGCTQCHDAPTEKIETTRGGTFDHKRFTERKVACAKCHFDTVQGNGDVPEQVCLTCHGEPERLAKRSDPVALHEWHVTKRKVECFRCHSEIRHGLHPVRAEAGNTCGTCHASGHVAAEQLFLGKGGLGVKESPHDHYKANVDCVACHETPPSALAATGPRTHKATEQSCILCHGDGRKGKLAKWQSDLNDQLGLVKDLLADAEQAYAALSDDNAQKAEIEPVLARARHNYQFVLNAKGVHNFEYAMDLLYKAEEDAEKADGAAKKAKKAEGASGE